MSVLMCCRDNSHIYAVLDGCTDRSEEIIDHIIDTYSGVPITRVYAPDVHELLSINAGLKAANQDEDGFNIVLQDDVILAEFRFEQKVLALYEWAGSKLGYVSFRLGANFKADAAISEEDVPYCDYVENAYGHGIQDADVLLPGQFAYRSVPIKSPVCIPTVLIRTLGSFNERLAPYGHDDLEFAVRLIKAGYRNGVFSLRFHSDVKWGGTRTSPHPLLNKIIARNMALIREWDGSAIADICTAEQPKDILKVPGLGESNDEAIGLAEWNKNRDKLQNFGTGNSINALSAAKAILKKMSNLFK
ncbi:hypothetical protein GALL_383240 [mine drainage metagenome]|uniref:Glycosyl transferase family 2 n=1 Tax=mine drainage metagenome TaxID=410659 RepID=A0A1J5QVK4_9ZZZZ